MDAVILAAGKGTRLRPHTLTTPKPLLPVQGRPLLDWSLAALPAAVRRVVVVVNYLAEQFDAYLPTQRHVRHWATVRQTEPRGTFDAVRAAAPLVSGDTVMVLNGDDLYGAADLAALAATPAGLLAHEVAEPRQFGVVFPSPDGTLERLVEKPDLDGPRPANIGAYLLPRRALELDVPLSPRGEYEITDAVAAVAARQALRVVPASFWLPIGTVEAWQAAQTADLSAMRRVG
jgi:NDP-sugar pyrophosphorylase family protein